MSEPDATSTDGAKRRGHAAGAVQTSSDLGLSGFAAAAAPLVARALLATAASGLRTWEGLAQVHGAHHLALLHPLLLASIGGQAAAETARLQADDLRAWLREIGDVPLQEARRLQAELEALSEVMAQGIEPPDPLAPHRRRWRPKPRTGARPEMADAAAAASTSSVIAELGFEPEMAALHDEIACWTAGCDEEVRPALEWQFVGGSKYFRPLTIFSCYRAAQGGGGGIPPQVMRSALAVELFHNMTLVVDDILDRSDSRRGRATLHARFGELTALMVSGYVVAEGYRMVRDDARAIELLSELLRRLGVAECVQWRLRRHPLGVEDWRAIAAEDTGSMFEVCACLGDRSGRLRRFGGLLGVLYHGCDDVGDVRGAKALGGGGTEDLRDGILTLPAALAVRDPAVARIFCDPGDGRDLDALRRSFEARLPEAEAQLDAVAEQARAEARLFAADPTPLLRLVEHTRRLSAR